jgi:hypothetical protein
LLWGFGILKKCLCSLLESRKNARHCSKLVGWERSEMRQTL